MLLWIQNAGACRVSFQRPLRQFADELRVDVALHSSTLIPGPGRNAERRHIGAAVHREHPDATEADTGLRCAARQRNGHERQPKFTLILRSRIDSLSRIKLAEQPEFR